MPCHQHTSKELKYDTCSQGISQFYLHIPCSSPNEMNHTCLCLPSWSWYSFTNPRGMEGWVGHGHHFLVSMKLYCLVISLSQVGQCNHYNLTVTPYPDVKSSRQKTFWESNGVSETSNEVECGHERQPCWNAENGQDVVDENRVCGWYDGTKAEHRKQHCAHTATHGMCYHYTCRSSGEKNNN